MQADPNYPAPSSQLPPVENLVAEILHCEANAVSASAELIASQVEAVREVVDLMERCRGRLIVTGMGKMNCIARKAVATLCSTGTPAVHLHPGEAMHGDLGILTDQDCLLLLSHSGETREVLDLLPHAKRMGVTTLGITSQSESSLARWCHATLVTGVNAEADPITQAPSCSTTVTLAICDALAITVMQRRGFTAEQFAIFHPGGFLGSKLLTRVGDLMHTGDRLPLAKPTDSVRRGIATMSSKRLGAVVITDANGQVSGMLTDGDLRRLIERVADGGETDLLDQPLARQMTIAPKTIGWDALAAEALRKMEDHGITVLPVVDGDLKLAGLIHLHDLIRAGLA